MDSGLLTLTALTRYLCPDCEDEMFFRPELSSFKEETSEGCAGSIFFAILIYECGKCESLYKLMKCLGDDGI